jgi:hypothetical protein
LRKNGSQLQINRLIRRRPLLDQIRPHGLTIIENPKAKIIAGDTMTFGCVLAAWYVAEALRLF